LAQARADAADRAALEAENGSLRRMVRDLGASMKRLNQEKVDLETAVEMEEEAFFNKARSPELHARNSAQRASPARRAGGGAAGPSGRQAQRRQAAQGVEGFEELGLKGDSGGLTTHEHPPNGDERAH